jgi:hypothetical protein
MFREKNAKEIFQAGRQYLPFFLMEAMADEDLITYLRTNKLDIIRTKESSRLAWADYALGLDSSLAPPRLAAFTMLSAFARFLLLLWLDEYENR